jgi:hypothetical protein
MHHGHSDQPLNTLALSATLHCFTGCAIGEVLGMAIGTALAWSNPATTVASIILAFAFGYALTIRPLIAGGVPLGRAGRLAFASDTLSITTMEIVDTAIIVVYPGALDAGLTDALFWQPRPRPVHRLLGGVSGEPVAAGAWAGTRGRARLPLSSPAAASSLPTSFRCADAVAVAPHIRDPGPVGAGRQLLPEPTGVGVERSRATR